MKKFEFLEHTADAKFRAYGASLEKAFENAALALKQVLNEKKAKPKIKKKIKVKAKDLNSLLYHFLEEFLFLFDSENFLLSKVKVKIKIKEMELEADVYGEEGKFINEGGVKAITYNEMEIGRQKNINHVQVVIDV
jgi:SHS2 domain-containing protein